MITMVRDLLAKGLDAALPEAVHQFLPDDVSAVPCIIIGRPRLTRSEQSFNAWDFDVPVFVLGNRTTSAESQQQLDDLAVAVMAAAETIVPTDSVGQIAVRDAEPTVTTVSGSDYPAYQVNLNLLVSSC